MTCIQCSTTILSVQYITHAYSIRAYIYLAIPSIRDLSPTLFAEPFRELIPSSMTFISALRLPISPRASVSHSTRKSNTARTSPKSSPSSPSPSYSFCCCCCCCCCWFTTSSYKVQLFPPIVKKEGWRRVEAGTGKKGVIVDGITIGTISCRV
ncbi:hypothetical protein BCR39DRAFT_525621 [Naematelia encephala]|uniref:Uncharacterized protein n=1 Tax=Naematelia encephala TaxID=71784 RepID=A0A1Y2BAF3_9TREE|nr:hypothetical protein BCR39DRAFT_525621 [Naematelia encephala]